MRVLVSAYACEPGAGSEPGAGWAWARAAALGHDVWLLTRANNAPKIDAALAREPGLRLHPVYLDLPRWARWWKRGGRGVHLYYFLWQGLAWRAARRLHRAHAFDVAHHLTFAVDWMPAGVGFVRGLPFVWGPVGGATGTPWVLWRWLGWRGVISEAVRELTTRPMRRLFGDPTARRAALVVAQNHDVARRFAKARRLVVEPHVALDLTRLRPAGQAREGCRALFVGRLVPWKGLSLAIATLGEPQAADWQLDVFGDGPERRRAERLVVRLGLEHRVHFHGNRSRAEVISTLRRADALLHPSMHDSAPWAVGEATTIGVPVICLDRGGPPVLIDGSSGSVVPPSHRLPSILAATLASTRAAGAVGRTWSAERLPGLLAHWYRTSSAIETPLERRSLVSAVGAGVADV